MPTRLDLDGRKGVAAIYTTKAKRADQDDNGPVDNPLAHIERVLFHTALPYWRVAAYQPPVAVRTAARGPGSGQATFRPGPWPTKHRARGALQLVLLLGSKANPVGQHMSGDVIPQGYSGKRDWRRMAATFKSGGVQIIDYWRGTHRARNLFMGYIVLSAESGVPAGGRAGRTVYDINPGAADPYMRIGNFDTRKNYLRGATKTSGQFSLFLDPNIYVAAGAAMVTMNAAGGLTRRPGTIAKPTLVHPKRPARMRFTAW